MEIPRQQLIHFICSLSCWQILQHMAQPSVWLNTIGLGCFNKRVDNRARVGSGYGITEQPSLASNHEGADRILASVIIVREPLSPPYPTEVKKDMLSLGELFAELLSWHRVEGGDRSNLMPLCSKHKACHH